MTRATLTVLYALTATHMFGRRARDALNQGQVHLVKLCADIIISCRAINLVRDAAPTSVTAAAAAVVAVRVAVEAAQGPDAPRQVVC